MSKRAPNISAIDYRISNLHSELMELYRRRSALSRNNSQLSMDMIANPWEALETARIYQAKWLEGQYQKLQADWSQYGIKIPSLANLSLSLATAHKIIKELSQVKPELRNNLEILLVPPTKTLGFPVKDEYRKKQYQVSGADVIEADFPTPTADKKWKLLVVYVAPAGLYLGSPDKILKDELYMIAGHDCRALGANEYNALSLQKNSRLDTDTWTLLMKKDKKNKTTSGLVGVATFSGNRYRFDTDDINSMFGDIRFRPAIEIEGSKV